MNQPDNTIRVLNELAEKYRSESDPCQKRLLLWRYLEQIQFIICKAYAWSLGQGDSPLCDLMPLNELGELMMRLNQGEAPSLLAPAKRPGRRASRNKQFFWANAAALIDVLMARFKKSEEEAARAIARELRSRGLLIDAARSESPPWKLNHNVPEQDVASGGSRETWPLGMGFDRFYGFLGGETNQWYPDLVEDNSFIEPPYGPEDGYHFSKDLADQAIRMIRDQKATNPSKPWFMWYNPGANHAPHQAPQDYIDKYKGKFDDGYEAYRTWVLARMIERGVMPEGTQLTPINPLPEDVANPADMVRPWDTLNADEKKLFSRMAEVFAAYSEYTDVQIGRIIDYLEQSGQLDNTIVIYAADNGTSGEGTPNGSVNENKLFNNYPDDLAENMRMIDQLGGPNTYGHFPTGWAVAFSTPFQMFKRYSQYSGGTADPLVISWPKGIKATARSATSTTIPRTSCRPS